MSSQRAQRVVWLAGTRGEILLLGPSFKALCRPPAEGGNPRAIGWLACTGEHGTAAYQTLDALALAPDETGALCHPADDPAVRLRLMLERTESFVHLRRASHVVFAGYGPTAAAAALCCHGRGCRGLWLRPADRLGIIGRLDWEAGLARVIAALAPRVAILDVPAMPDAVAEGLAAAPPSSPLEAEIPGLRDAAPLALVAIYRREWGVTHGNAASRLIHAAGRWAEAAPERDWVISSTLNMRLEGPFRALERRPANLLRVPPLPYPLWRELLGRAELVLTDSPLIADEALQRAIPVLTLGERNPDRADHAITPDELNSPALRERLDRARARPVPANVPPPIPTPHAWITDRIVQWLAREEEP